MTIDEFLEKMRDGLNDFEGYVKIDYNNEYIDHSPEEWYNIFFHFVNEFQFKWALTPEKEEVDNNHQS